MPQDAERRAKPRVKPRAKLAPKPRAKPESPRAKPAPKPRAAPGLSRERILSAALELVDRDGVDALSLRGLATRLGVFPTAIYWYVPSRNELISGAVALALANVTGGLADGDWQQRLRSLLGRFRLALQRHPRLAQTVGGELISNSPLDLPLLDYIVLALEDAGFGGDAMVDAFNVVVAAMCGFAVMELAAAPSDGAAAWALAHRERVAAIAPAEFPALSRHLAGLRDRAFILRSSSGTHQPLDSSFDAWVDVLLGGLAARAARRSAQVDAPSKGPHRSAKPATASTKRSTASGVIGSDSATKPRRAT